MERQFNRKIRFFPSRPIHLLAICSLLPGVLLLSACSRTTPYRSDANGFWYRLQEGDTLTGISSRFSVDPWTLRKRNDIYDPNDLREGMRIFIPGVRPLERGEETPKNATGTHRPGRFVWPAGGVISSGFGMRHGKMHQGIDITKDGGREIVAARSGKVIFSGRKNGYGNTIIIDHGQDVRTLYAHNQTLYVKRGDRVRQRRRIAKMGSTGRSSGIHLHFEIIVKGKPHNPLRYLPIR